jgi:hypothetical protein
MLNPQAREAIASTRIAKMIFAFMGISFCALYEGDSKGLQNHTGHTRARLALA